ncbi:alkanesulfonate monooxygenase SsuD/methylene tetrahydromethanopterin reductase-like flavin-dependent oxidoreductase (luciferase family) [Thermocatellispora tengchongensis]|uniref:Alkanesulfonate monooxygenase SsuD/methylene tetrahydromethanopterin reductase-like flavin-dependent oxidoreductase (Luciferase family) n=1 Tax=Thermocatellispora tengchongensis TaxID=1073253 RepID=A0A840P847_9ACTN|nr:LLM class flavin-dependent oxidoreductase [Thermocatellispora tengchongensis]MBB5133387.1 alkanesulfonate monooxygenase SsuD/methylene tetrahydromethanopterin reductase-like flavin-dependent oxidoreductase (luciferase family) [Thermocatellispora tengchongensis]
MPNPREGKVILGVNVLVLGYLPAAWQSTRLHPHSFIDPGYWNQIGEVAERATLDAVFLADGPALGDPSYDANAGRLEPVVNWSHVAAATERIGLIATASTTLNDPFDLAQRLLSLDHVSGGRAGWNIVTTRDGSAARNFGLPDIPARDDRYDRAAEFVDLILALWESAETGREVHHRGRFFDLDGRLRVPPSRQGHPVLLQAGGSAKGRALAGRRAEGVFAAELTKQGAIEHYREVKRHAIDAGRSPDSVKILPGLLLSLGSTEEEARRRSDELHELGPESYSVQWLSQAIGYDVSRLDLDARFPQDVLDAIIDPAHAGGSIGFRQSIYEQIRATGPTVREYLRQTRYTGSGHGGFVGTPEQLVDHIEDWWRSGAVDGFNLQPDVLVDGLEVIADEVVPLLRKRGLFRHEYTTDTLRGHFQAASA